MSLFVIKNSTACFDAGESKSAGGANEKLLSQKGNKILGRRARCHLKQRRTRIHIVSLLIAQLIALRSRARRFREFPLRNLIKGVRAGLLTTKTKQKVGWRKRVRPLGQKRGLSKKLQGARTQYTPPYLVMILNGLADVALAPPAGKKSTDSIE